MNFFTWYSVAAHTKVQRERTRKEKAANKKKTMYVLHAFTAKLRAL